ncbi:hypothetical protein O181_121552 [Austropuccinia psidii MF-1]|uniref:Phenylalanyl-tRNA synthetase domain-containing protein n=1 Tax=Austropuccinia psidii MF-1 TaxID=1389203 RepID=A0A9Q3KLD4_9BASI|nr:hypothetical protein [Austropuccinia psidii MF-1]
MTIVNKDLHIHKNADGLSRWPLPNNIDNPSYYPEEASPKIPIEGISVTDLNTTFFEELSHKTSIHPSTNKTTAIIEKRWNRKLPQDSLRKDLVEIHATAASFKGMLEKTIKHAIRCMEDSFAYSKDKWDKSHATQYFEVGGLVLESTTNFNNIKDVKSSKTPLQVLLLSRPSIEKILLK